MRHPSRKQDPLQTPLNDILGSRGAVRTLRVLAEAGHPIGRAQVARKAGLNASGVRRTLDRLAAAGIIEIVGSGRNLAVRLRDEHPLTEPLRSLFDAERRLFASAVDILRGQLSRADLPVKAIWIESPEGRSPGMVDIGVLADPPALESSVATVQGYLEAAEEAMGMHFTVRGYTDADRLAGGEQERRLGDVTLLHGWIPVAWRAEAGGPIATHRELDRRTRRLAKAVADLLPNDPSLVARATEWIDGRLATADERASHELNEWRRILSRLSVPQIQALLTEDTERADRLRQSLPFVEALSPTERAELLEKARL